MIMKFIRRDVLNLKTEKCQYIYKTSINDIPECKYG